MSIHKDNATGKWRVVYRYTDWTGETHQSSKRGFPTKREAQMWERELLLKKEAKLDMTFESFYEIYVEDMQNRIRDNTWGTKTNIARTKILPYFGKRKIGEIEPRDIIAWQNELLAIRQPNGKPYSASYLQKIHSQLSAIFNHAVNFYHLPSNPAQKAGNMGKEEHREMLFWTKEEYLKFADAMMDKPVSYYAFEILYWCGLRMGELLALTPADFNFETHAELTRIPFFSQISDEAFINMTPSLNIAFNKDLEKDQEKLDLAFDVLECMISKEGQTLIADGKGVISLNVDVPNMMEDIPGLEDEINNNSVYIRYSAQKSFDASLKAVHGLLSGEMDETQAYDAFRSTMNSKDSKEETTVNFENEYAISLNDKNGRDAASSILTTIREENDAQLALVPYYYFTSSIYKGECTGSRVALMTAKSSDTFLYLAKINGKEIYELAEKYLAESDEKFHITNKYELPVASGMKIIVRQEENGFSLKDIEVNKKKIDKDKEYSILLTETTMSVLKKINPECEIRQLGNTTLSSAWTAAMENGQQPSAPEDYIEVEK